MRSLRILTFLLFSILTMNIRLRSMPRTQGHHGLVFVFDVNRLQQLKSSSSFKLWITWPWLKFQLLMLFLKFFATTLHSFYAPAWCHPHLHYPIIASFCLNTIWAIDYCYIFTLDMTSFLIELFLLSSTFAITMTCLSFDISSIFFLNFFLIYYDVVLASFHICFSYLI